MKSAIRQRARELGFDDCRVTTAASPDHAEVFRRWIGAKHHGEMAYLERNAHKRVDPHQVLAGARSIITLAVSYSGERDTPGRGDSSLPSLSPGRGPTGEKGFAAQTQWDAGAVPIACGVIARYARFADYHDVIGRRLKSLTEFVNQLGGPAARSLWYVDTGPLLERDLAQRSGLGFIGKHTNVISRQLGNWVFLCEIITTLEIEPDEPEKNRCGSCTRCIAACPTNAITAPFTLDARRCISYLTIELKGPIPFEFRPLIGNRIYGCDDCLAACPWNRFAREGSMMKPHSRSDLAAPELVSLLALDDAGFRKRFAGTPIFRTKRRGLLRNVCVALGNVGDERAVPALERALSDPEPLVREHAAWAIERIVRRADADDAGTPASGGPSP